MNDKLTEINVKFEIWKAAYQQIRQVESWEIAAITPDGITPDHAARAVKDARKLADRLRELADQVENQADRADNWIPEPVALLPCPFCNATEHLTYTGDLIPAIRVDRPLPKRWPNQFEADCCNCGEGWSITSDDPEYPAILDDVYRVKTGIK